MTPIIGARGVRKCVGREPDGGLIIVPDAFTTAHREVIIELVTSHRLPAIYALPYFAKGGGLLSYGVDILDLHRRAASYVDPP